MYQLPRTINSSLVRRAQSLHARNSLGSQLPQTHRGVLRRALNDDDEKTPDWDAEMQVFKKRTNTPSALEMLRQIAAEDVDTGKVLYCEDGLAIVANLNNDADVGTQLMFDTGAVGALLWRRDDNLVYVAVLENADSVKPGVGVKCSVRGVLQLVDETQGAVTRRDYEVVKVYTGPATKGAVVDYMGRPIVDGVPTAAPAAGPTLPMFNRQPDMESREPINAGHITGIKYVDALTPIGKGQSLLFTGLQGSGKTIAGLDTIINQRANGVRCVYACVGHEAADVERARAYLAQHNALANTTIVACNKDRPLAEQFAAICTALSIAEQDRDHEGDAIVVIDDIRCVVDVWERIIAALSLLGPAYLKYKGKEAEGLSGAGLSDSGEDLTDEELVEYEGMLVSVSAAQRRRFFSSVIQRAAKLHRRLGGGTLTLLPVLAGAPATGSAQGQKARAAIMAAKGLSDEQKQRMIAALEQKEKVEGVAQLGGPRGVRTEVIEEFMSMTDGQVVFEPARDVQGNFALRINASSSVSRIGTRAYARSMENLAALLRFALSQAADSARFSANPNDPAMKAEQQRAERIHWALMQRTGPGCSVAEQVVHLLALQKGLLDKSTSAAEVEAILKYVTQRVMQDQALVKQLAECTQAEAEATVEKAAAVLTRI